MNLLYTIHHKGKLAILLLAVVLLEIFSSNIYTSNINQMSSSFSELYSDRLVAQDYIYKLAEILYKKKYALIELNSSEVAINKIVPEEKAQISGLLNSYEKTQLTSYENLLFREFRKNVSAMLLTEQELLESDSANLKSLIGEQDRLLTLSLDQLDKLSEIQLSRGKNLNETSLKTASFSNLLNQFDMAIVIIIGITIQALVFASTSTIPKNPQNHLLN